jgi:phage repressor protein C with HTH and peptisase S24 domain
LITERSHKIGGLSEIQLGKLLGISPQAINRLTRGATQLPTKRGLARKLAEFFDVDIQYFYDENAPRRMGGEDIARGRAQPSPSPPSGHSPPPQFLGENDLPVFAATEAGPGEMVVSSDPIEYVPRPWYLKGAKDGYAVLVVGESMEPRYSPGEIVIVNPKAALVRGKDAIITTAQEGGDFRAMIKTYLGATQDVWKLKQFNPPPGAKSEFQVTKKEWPHAVRVVGRYDGG